MTTRLISFLGIGPGSMPPYYTPCCYEWQGSVSGQTPLVERAILQLFHPVDEIVVLGTIEVEQRWIDTGLLSEHLGQAFSFRKVPSGCAETDLRAIFEVVVAAFGLTTDTRVDRVLLDVTHGFRIQPILATSALAFALSEWERRGLPAPELRVLYGAFEARHEGVAPVWDLTEIVTVARWNSALDALLRFGRADSINALAEATSRAATTQARLQGAAGRELARHAHLRQIGAAAKDFADDLALGRVKHLFQNSSIRLLQALNAPAAEEWVVRLPVLHGAIDALKATVNSFSSHSVLGEDGPEAMAALAKHLGNLQRFAEQAATLREALFTHIGWRLGFGTQPGPGQPGCGRARDIVEQAVGVLLNRWRNGATFRQESDKWPLGPALALADEVTQLRNDIEHLGIRNNPQTARTLRDKLAELCQRFADLAESPGPTAFLNLSNHPVATWPKEQLAEARNLKLGEPQDLQGGMPQVDPKLRSDELSELAVKVADLAVRQGANGAFVATDATFNYILVLELRKRGIRCFSTTTTRDAREKQAPDGGVHRTLVYQFVGWREYPHS